MIQLSFQYKKLNNDQQKSDSGAEKRQQAPQREYQVEGVHGEGEGAHYDLDAEDVCLNGENTKFT